MTSEPAIIPRASSMACHICGSGDGVRLYEGSDKKFRGPGRFTYVRCRPCGLVYLHPRPSDRELSRYYPDYVTPVSTTSGSSSWERMRQRLKRMVAAEWYGYSGSPGGTSRWLFRPLRKALTLPISPLLSQVPRAQAGGRVLDIGCGSGGYLAFLASLGWTCVGIEPGPQSRAYAQDDLGLTVHAGPLTACALPEASFSVVTMWHVIEHLPDPLKTLREIHQLLKADGIVMLRTPNVDSFEARLFRGNWYGLDPPRHLYLFSPRTIRALLKRSGFAITRLRYEYHAHDCSRSLLYLAEDRGRQSLRQIVARWNRSLELSLTALAPFRRLFGSGAIMHVEARKAMR